MLPAAKSDVKKTVKDRIARVTGLLGGVGEGEWREGVEKEEEELKSRAEERRRGHKTD